MFIPQSRQVVKGIIHIIFRGFLLQFLCHSGKIIRFQTFRKTFQRRCVAIKRSAWQDRAAVILFSLTIVLFFLFFIYMFITIRQGLKNPESHDEEEEQAKQKPLWMELVLLIGGAAIIAVGADLLVDNGYYSNRSDFINQALREGLQKHQSTIDRIIDKKTESNSESSRSF